MERTAALVLASLAAMGCATHRQMRAPPALSRSALLADQPDEAKRLEAAMTDRDIARLLDARITARLPTKMAVAGLLASCGSIYGMKTISARELEGWERAAAGLGPILGIQPVAVLATGKDHVSLHDLRTSAARMGCELLLVYVESESTVDNFNDAAVLYWTLIGIWLVPGNVFEHRTVVQGILLDTRTGAILGTATGDAHLKRLTPLAFVSIQRDKLSREAPAQAMDDFQKAGKTLLEDVARTAAKPPA